MSSLGTSAKSESAKSRGTLVRQNPKLALPEGLAEHLGPVVGPTKYGDPRTGKEAYCLDLLSPENASAPLARFALPFFAHGFAPRRDRPALAALTEKQGPGGALVDLEQQKVLRPIEPLAGHHFYGHGAFTADARFFLAVESDVRSGAHTAGRGCITLRDGDSLEILEEFPSFGHAPHDCQLVEEGKTLVITNGGRGLDAASNEERPSVVFIDWKTRSLLERHVIPETRWNAGHVAVGANRAFAVVSAPRYGLGESELGGVSLRPAGKDIRSLKDPEELTSHLTGESLSVAWSDPHQRVVATSPYGDRLSLWSSETGELIESWQLEAARGVCIARDGNHAIVAHGPRASLALLHLASGQLLSTNLLEQASVCSGSHLFPWEGPPSQPLS